MRKGLKRNILYKNGYVELELTGGEYTKVDIDIIEKIRQYCWYKSIRGSVESRIGNKLIKLHRYVLGAKKGEFVDHINGDKLDNRKNKLRICSQQENTFNKKACKNSKSGIKGVWFDIKNNKYAVQISKDGKRYWGGYFKNLDDAIKRVNELTVKIHGKFANIQYN